MAPLTPLDAEAVGLCHRMAGKAFPWNITHARELALRRTFCLPSMSALLSRTGRMVAELLRHGPDSLAGTAVIERLPHIHCHDAITNADSLDVLSGFVTEPIRWLNRYDWQPLTAAEQQALFHLWRRVGARMGMAELPTTLKPLLADWPQPLRPPLAALLRVLRLWPPRHSRFDSERLNRARWSGRQRRIGLTGGIASGKSSVGRLLAAVGLPVLDADVYAREALAPGSAGAKAVLARYGTLDRAALGRIVFADAAERQWLEQLVHPLVRARFAAELEELDTAPVVVLMIPLLFEAGLEPLCSEVWLVDCDANQQQQRLMARDQLSEAEARARIAAQWPLERKRGLADVLLDNRSEPQHLERQVAAALQTCT